MLRDKMPEKESALPPSLAAAWGLAEPGSRGPRPGMTAAAIVQAAIELADADGIGAVSMSRVAQRLGYTPMSLYRYVASKDDLVALMFDAAMDPVPTTGSPAGMAARPAPVGARADGRLRAPPVGARHPDHRPAGAAQPARLARLRPRRARADRAAGAAERLSVMLLVSGYVRNVAQLTRDLSSQHARAGSTPAEVGEQYQHLLEQLVTRDRFPHLHDALFAGLLTDGSAEDDLEFEFGLQRILDGIEALVERRRS